MIRFLHILLAAFWLTGCAYKAQPVLNPEISVPSSAGALSLQQLEQRIIEAGRIRNWQFSRAEPGHLIARQIQPKHSATVDIYFDQQRVRIAKKETSGLRDTGGTIHSHYNVWIRNLEQDIQASLGRSG